MTGGLRLASFLAALLLGGGGPPPAPLVGPPPTVRLYSVHLPAVLVPGRVTPVPSATATPRPTTAPSPEPQRPTTYEELRRCLAVRGATCWPVPGVYRPSRPLTFAPGSTLDGQGQVTIVGKTLELYKADGATVRRVAVRDAAGDGIRVSHTRGALIEDVQVSGSHDGEIDIVEGPDPDGRSVFVTVRRATIGPGRKCMLIGDPDQSQDAWLVVVLDHVDFVDCGVRVPKVHWAWVEIRGGTVFRWRGPRLDVQLGGRVRLKGTTWVAGPESLPGYYLPTGGQVEDLGGNVFRPWRGDQ